MCSSDLRSMSEKVQYSQLENLENEYEGKVYKIEQIEKLCVDYRLRFLQSKYYTGSYDVQVAAKIKEFAVSTNSPIDDYTLGRRFYMLAPEEMFQLQNEKYVSKSDLRRQADPAIFFQIDERHYRLIHKWGEDFTIFRLIKGFRWKSWWSHQWFNTVMLLPIVAFAFTIA